MKLVIGLTGEKGSGKETFTQILRSLAPYSIMVERFSDILDETLRAWNLPLTRVNFQKLSATMDRTYGDGTLSQAIGHRIHGKTDDIILLDGMRWETDYQLLRSFPRNILVYITADSRIRFERLKKRNEKSGEGDMSWDQFESEEKDVAEATISLIGKRSDIQLTNNGSREEFAGKVQKTYAERIRPLLK